MSLENFRLFSDGGGEKASNAASACIIDDVRAQKRFKIVAFLGAATNNEAEIIGGLLGFAFLKSVSGVELSTLRWVSDSEYLLKSATGYIHQWQQNGWKTAQKKPVKNQGLWRAYLELARGWKIVPEHVYGHSGHEENEECDSICTWLRGKTRHGFDEAEGLVYGAVDSRDAIGWLVVDGRPFLEALRIDEPADDAVLRLVASIQVLAPNGFAETAPRETGRSRKRLLTQAGQKLVEAEILLSEIDGSDSAIDEIRKTIVSLERKLKQADSA